MVTMARSRARSRSPRNCRWEDQGWNCICSSCDAALRTWKGGHVEREKREGQPKGTADAIIISQLRRVPTRGYHPSVRCVPDFVDGRRQLQDKCQKLKDKLMRRKPRCEAEEEAEKEGDFQATCTSTEEEDMD